uniref:methionine--tRNA ligase n=2 Tax=Phaeomonas parva TaxID=124430 RepID=A0A7S1TU78_9STRA|mmetsp:Transcript_1805/g.5175  ORF Transcript_1805/g.5175 Transcript_1805/m.5175 type:complete len:499 (+) Transcript_1805:40-1536(+)
MAGRDVFFLTGSDEHGQKIAKRAEDEGTTPIAICDRYSSAFKALNQRLLVSNDGYVRTTDEDHMAICRRLWQQCAATLGPDGSDIYLTQYEGWYNVREETFVSETDAQLTNYMDPTSGQPLTKTSEESYFFRMSRYQERLVAHIQANPDFIQPPEKRGDILKRLEEPLRDLCVSRTTFDWGITLPEGYETNHVMYVWFDALTNYLSGVEVEGAAIGDNKFWPADVHIIGKDIIWFHTVIWPCMLMSANIPLPGAVFAHGFISGSDGQKMSKSLGNVVDPHDLLDFVGVDTFRWYMATESMFGKDLSFSTGNLILKHNSDLAHTLGNLVHRATSFCVANCDGRVPEETYGAAMGVELPFGFEVTAKAEELMRLNDFTAVGELVMSSLRALNTFITVQEPWKKKDNPPLRNAIVRAVVEGVWYLAHLLEPFCPVGAKKIFGKIEHPPQPLLALGLSGPIENVVPSGTAVTAGEILYAEINNCVENPEGSAKGACNTTANP